MEVIEEKLDEANEELLNEIEDTLGLGKNQEVLRDIIRYHQVMQKEKCNIDFENYNIIIRNESNYYLYEDLIAAIAKVYAKNGIIKKEAVHYITRKRLQ